MERVRTTSRRARAARNPERRRTARPRTVPRVSTDEAFIALLIGAMEANGHVGREEAARAHHIVWSMKRFRNRSGDAVGRLIDRGRRLVDAYGADAVVAAAVRSIPVRARGAAFALSTDLVLADGRVDRAERRFLDRLAAVLGLDRMTRDLILDAMLVKNSV